MRSYSCPRWPKSVQRRPRRLLRAALNVPKCVPEGFESLSKSSSVIFQNLRSRLHGSAILRGRGAPQSDQNRLSKASRGLLEGESHSREPVERLRMPEEPSRDAQMDARRPREGPGDHWPTVEEGLRKDWGRTGEGSFRARGLPNRSKIYEKSEQTNLGSNTPKGLANI